jgi:hypothetical protein
MMQLQPGGGGGGALESLASRHDQVVSLAADPASADEVRRKVNALAGECALEAGKLLSTVDSRSNRPLYDPGAAIVPTRGGPLSLRDVHRRCREEERRSADGAREGAARANEKKKEERAKVAGFDELVGIRTEGYERFLAQPVDLGRWKPLRLEPAAGDCFVFVIRATTGALGEKARRGEGTLEIVEPTRDYTFPPEWRPEGGVTTRYCLIKGGPMKVSLYKTTSIGQGAGTFELWKKTLGPEELASLREGRRLQKKREEFFDAEAAAAPARYTCANCSEELRSCQTGQTRPSLSSTCAKDFYQCADHAAMYHGKKCY